MRRRTPAGRIGGDLGEFGLPELVQTLQMGRKTARLVLRARGRRGEIWFQDGAITHAATSTLLGDLAVYEMLDWSEGQFAVEYGVETSARSISQDPTFLLLEGLRRIDERPASVEAAPATASPRTARAIAGVVVATVAVAALAAINLVGGPETTEALETSIPRAPVVVAQTQPPVKKPASSKRSTAKAVKPEPLANQPSPVVPEPALMLDSMEPATVPTASTLIVLGTSSGARGAIVLLVDGKPVFTHDPSVATSFETRIDVTPGEHLLVARLEGTKENGEDSVRASFSSGESQTLRITADRRLGAPVKVRLYEFVSSRREVTATPESALR